MTTAARCFIAARNTGSYSHCNRIESGLFFSCTMRCGTSSMPASSAQPSANQIAYAAVDEPQRGDDVQHRGRDEPICQQDQRSRSSSRSSARAARAQ